MKPSLIGLSFGLIACADLETIENDGIDTNIEETDLLDIPEGSQDAHSQQESFILHGFDWENDPARFSTEYTRNIDELPLRASLNVQPWSGDYWAKNKGGISYRWQTEESFDYSQLTKDELLAASVEEIAELSPAEKYDILVGNYKFSLTHKAKAQGSVTEASWSGYCHGWSPASLRFEEPSPITLQNPDGIEIPFGSSDVKALLTYFEGEVLSSMVSPQEEWYAETNVIGSVCVSGKLEDLSCTDTNPGAFHIVLGNQIGLEGQGFNMDVDSGAEKWNQPVYAYRSQLLETLPPSDYAEEGTVIEYIMRTEVHWTVEIHPTWEPVLHTENQKTASKMYLYSLEINENHEIIGGQWLTPLQDGGYATLPEVWTYFSSQTDMTEEQAVANTWHYFDIPDYLWLHEDKELPEDFKMIDGPYDIINNSSSNREKLFRYFAELGQLIEE